MPKDFTAAASEPELMKTRECNLSEILAAEQAQGEARRAEEPSEWLNPDNVQLVDDGDGADTVAAQPSTREPPLRPSKAPTAGQSLGRQAPVQHTTWPQKARALRARPQPVMVREDAEGREGPVAPPVAPPVADGVPLDVTLPPQFPPLRRGAFATEAVGASAGPPRPFRGARVRYVLAATLALGAGALYWVSEAGPGERALAAPGASPALETSPLTTQPVAAAALPDFLALGWSEEEPSHPTPERPPSEPADAAEAAAAPQLPSTAPEPARGGAGAALGTAERQGKAAVGESAPTAPAVEAPARPEPLQAGPRQAATQKVVQPGPGPVARYVFAADELFSVETAPGFSTDLLLQPGEALTAHPTAGDSARWVISVQRSEMFGGGAQHHVFVRPLRQGLATSLTITTNRRTYLLQLSSSGGHYMPAVRWSYPEYRARQRRVEQSRTEVPQTTDVRDIAALQCRYELTSTTGRLPWAPRSVCDDGYKTFVQFSAPLTRATAPAVLVHHSERTRGASFINVDIEGDMLVVHGTFDVAELRKTVREQGGKLREQIVRMARKSR